ncbi:ABC transporter ATP-binding protein [Acrocarpospora catenulata]|uniref:ABC transporter ATP-binding protein n=1 Tax=Acrocarpospora catenulata TaxID=2836182 RepID=UPI001BDADD57|nr:ABC transporter ATP-binding protein [Acrocarpospora catenulata]
MTALEATGLGKRYGDKWALKDVFLTVPEGRIIALVGPNGAGKTTLMNLTVGLRRPTTGQIHVFGRPPYGESLQHVAFVAQEKPLYPEFTVAETLRLGERLNPRFDQPAARTRLDELGIPLKSKIRALSGGQRAQVAITLAVAKRAELIVLDEPLANLDPLARHEVMEGLMAAVADTGMTVLLSSHVIAELNDVCDHLILVSGGRVQVAGDIEDIVHRHRLLVGPAGTAPAGPYDVVSERTTERQSTLLVRMRGPIHDPRWTVRDLALEDVVLGYMRARDSVHLPPPTIAGTEDVA